MRDILDRFGLITLFSSLMANSIQWLADIKWNEAFLMVTSFLGIIYLIVKIYSKILETKQFKKDHNIKKFFF